MVRSIIFSCIVVAVGAVLYVLPQKAGMRKRKQGAVVLTVFYAVGNVYFTLLSRITISARDLERFFAKIFFKPILDTAPDRDAALDEMLAPKKTYARTSPLYYLESCVLNTLLYVPLGYLLPCVFPKLRGRPWVTVALGFCVSLVTELLQLLFHIGMFDVRDLVCNTLGTTVGVVFYHFVLAKQWKTV